MISRLQVAKIPEAARRSRLWLAAAAVLAVSLGGCVYAPPPPAAGYAYAPDAYYYPYYSPYYYAPGYYYPPVYGSVGFGFGFAGHRHFH
ncbi:MAG TPA: hypothetical protein VJ747_05830 [Stellaceae bacterium]|nr:hypothetical protein [Stellaceae bacterium]